MAYALKTPDGTSLYRKQGIAQIVNEVLPDGVDSNRVWPVNEDVPEGYLRADWQIVNGVCEPVLIEKPDPTEQAIWQDKLNGDIDVTFGEISISLKANLSAKNTFTGMFTLLAGALSRGLITESTPQSIWDSSNVEHTMTTGEVLAVLLMYGFQWQQMFNEFAP